MGDGTRTGTLQDLLTLVGMRRAGAPELRAFLLGVGVCLLLALGISALLTPRAGVVLAGGLLPAIALHRWARFEQRSGWLKLLALALALAFATLVLLSAAGLTPFSSGTSYYRAKRFAKTGVFFALAPSCLVLGYAWLRDGALRPNPERFLAISAFVGMAAGAVLGLCVLRSSDFYLLPFFSVFGGLKTFMLGRKLLLVQLAAHADAVELGEERRRRDPIRRAGLTPDGVARVFRTLARIAHADGRVDVEERALLEALRARFELSPAEGDRLEAEGRNLERLQIGRRAAERSLLHEAVERWVAHKPELGRQEARLVRTVFHALRADRPRRATA